MAKLGWGKILAGVATVAAAGAAYIYLKQRTAASPLYDVVLNDGGFEIRRYPTLLVIETIQHGSRDRALGNGFGLLADHMFGEARDGEEIPITMPFIAERLDERAWRIRFLVAEEYAAMLEPLGRGVGIGEIAAREVAVLSIPGKATDRVVAAKTAELQRWATAQGRSANGDGELAYYNSPLDPGVVRANEIFLPLAG